MRIFKLLLSFLFTIGLIYLLDNRWVIKNIPVPPLGKFLDPFQGFWNNIESDSTQKTELNIDGLKTKVTVVFDSLMIPHIFAQNDEDLYLAQGFITAQHRLWQMEFQTHAAAGRISEIIGAGPKGAYLNYDRGQRRLGMVYGAQHALDAMMANPTSKMMVEKYTEGINRYIETLTYKDLPFEYKLLNYTPEPWTPLKCALLLKNMAQSLSIGDKDIEMTNALKLYGFDVVELLYPDRETVSDPIVDNANGWKFNSIKLDTLPLAVPQALINVKSLPKADPTTGSNNWAVSGDRTSTGSPILCGDPHLNLSLPSIWYAIQLKAPGVNVMGASLPGAPAIIIGFNDSIAWSVTNAQRDLVDWFQITFENEKKDRYLLDGNWVNTKKVIEKFNIRDTASFYDTVAYTYFGPVVYDESYHADDNLKHYAFRWVAHDPSEEIITFFKLNRAKNYTDYMAALDHYSAPPQNFVFASVAGDIAMRIQGKYPARRQFEGKYVLDGTKSALAAQTYIPNEQNVMIKNPVRGFVSSANQYPVDATYPYYITASHFEAYRNRHINSILTAYDSIGVSDMMKLQNDNFNLKAQESLPQFLRYLDSATLTAQEKNAFTILQQWNYYNDTNAAGASYYEAWWDNIMPLAWDELEKDNVALTRPTTFTTIKLLIEKPDLSFFDIQSTPQKETARDVVQKAFSLAVADVEAWKKSARNNNVYWADYKDSFIGHLTRLPALRVKVRAGGNHDIVNAHSQTHGPSWRMIVSLEEKGIKTWAAYPGGQSGNPGSKHYTNMLNHWINGKYFLLHFLHAEEEGHGDAFTITHLNPK